MRADRHIVIGSAGTAIMSDRAVALIDAPPASAPALAWESLLFGTDGASGPLDPIATLPTDELTAFALVEATTIGTAITRHGATIVAIHDRPWTTGDDTATTTVGADDPITISLDTSDAPTGQWVTSGVVAAGTVVVGRLTAPTTAPTTQVNEVVQIEPDSVAGDPADFGSLLGGFVAPAPADSPASTDTPATDDTPAGETKAHTAAFFHDEALARDAVLRTNDDRTFPVTTPIVFGRRPPSDPIGGQVPQLVEIDDPLISRHHATALIVDGRLVVIDEGSTNGTSVHVPGDTPVRCEPNQPTEVAPGSIINIAGVLHAVHEAGTI